MAFFYSLEAMWKALILLILMSSAAQAAPAPTYIHYLHGRIVEEQGPRGVSPRFGAYDYPGIIAALSAPGVKVVSEVRPRDTDVSAYADKVVARIRELLRRGVAPSRILVAGASKGAVIAALVSTRLKQPAVRYVLLGNCNEEMTRTYGLRLSGEVLSIYEQSDEFGQSCAPLAHASPDLRRFREVKLRTGLGHGFLYRPLPQWVRPALAWARR